jgi:hypothetical protein
MDLFCLSKSLGVNNIGGLPGREEIYAGIG